MDKAFVTPGYSGVALEPPQLVLLVQSIRGDRLYLSLLHFLLARYTTYIVLLFQGLQEISLHEAPVVIRLKF